MIKAISLKRVW